MNLFRIKGRKVEISKLTRFCSIVAINFFAIIVIYLIMNMIAPIYIRIGEKLIIPGLSPSKLQLVHPDMVQSDISILMDETWKRPWVYQPWVGFKERPRSGKFVNISEEGFRHSHIKKLSLESKGMNIYVFGGSTTFGYGVKDDSTIPSYLQEYFSRQHPNRDINVFNFGRGYYNSTQERTLLLELILRDQIPSIAIFIDGANEGGKRTHYFAKELSQLFDAYNYDNFALFRILIEQSPLMRLTSKILNNITNSSLIKNETVEVEPSPLEIQKTYLHNKTIINLLAHQYNFTAYFFIQPVPGYRNKFLNHMFMQKGEVQQLTEHILPKMPLLEKTVDNINSFNLTNVLEKYDHQPFVDNVHYTADVCKLIATDIAYKIKIPEEN